MHLLPFEAMHSEVDEVLQAGELCSLLGIAELFNELSAVDWTKEPKALTE